MTKHNPERSPIMKRDLLKSGIIVVISFLVLVLSDHNDHTTREVCCFIMGGMSAKIIILCQEEEEELKRKEKMKNNNSNIDLQGKTTNSSSSFVSVLTDTSRIRKMLLEKYSKNNENNT